MNPSGTASILLVILIFVFIAIAETQQLCSGRLENALEHMRRRSSQPSKGRSFDETPYSVYQSIYGNNKDDEDFYNEDDASRSKLFDRPRKHSHLDGAFDPKVHNRQPHTLPVSRVDVEDLRVRLPQKAARWVEVDKCRFTNVNRTLDTRLIFPDLTISGKVVLYPTGGRCNMILRLRHAGIEFRTVPMGGLDESRNNRPIASVRTDSHFAEPGFISVFAHGCQGPTGIKLRQNSKRRFGFDESPGGPEGSTPGVYPGPDGQRRWGKAYNPYRPPYDHSYDEPPYRRRYTRQAPSPGEGPFEDLIQFEDDVLHFNDDLDQLQSDARTFADIFSENLNMERSNPSKWLNVAELGSSGPSNSDDSINNALTKELEQLFSMGVKGLLTKYMQRALQPAIKETLMENMGYTLSYG